MCYDAVVFSVDNILLILESYVRVLPVGRFDFSVKSNEKFGYNTKYQNIQTYHVVRDIVIFIDINIMIGILDLLQV